jgi:hypothetical protein
MLERIGWTGIGLFIAVKIALYCAFAFEQITGRPFHVIGPAHGAELTGRSTGADWRAATPDERHSGSWQQQRCSRRRR